MAPPANEPPAIAIDLLKGGNPKVMFINYKIDARRRALDRPMTKVEVSDARATAVVDFDASAQIRARWKELFEIKQQRKESSEQSKGLGLLLQLSKAKEWRIVCGLLPCKALLARPLLRLFLTQ